MLLFIIVKPHTHTHIKRYMTFDFFYISRSLEVPSVDHLNMNKHLTTDYQFLHKFLE